MKFTEKIAGGKLVTIEIQAEGGRVACASITGDFFLHPEDAIDGIENVLTGVPLSSTQNEIKIKIDEALAEKNASFIGVTSEDIGRIFVKAVSQE